MVSSPTRRSKFSNLNLYSSPCVRAYGVFPPSSLSPQTKKNTHAHILNEVSQLIRMHGFVRNMKIFCSEDLLWFQSHWSRDILHGNFRLLFGNPMVVMHTLFTNLTPQCHLCWMWHSEQMSQVYGVNRDGCHMWGRKFSLYPEHLIAFLLGSSWFYPFTIYTFHITEFVSVRTMFTD